MKDLIVDLVIDDIIGRIELPGPEAGDWVERLRACFVSAHDEVAPYEDLAARMGHEMPTSPSARRNEVYLNQLFESAGLSETDARRVNLAVFVYVWGHLLAADSIKKVSGGALGEEESREQFLWGLDRLLSAFRAEFGPAAGVP
jgi:hypothetical protein